MKKRTIRPLAVFGLLAALSIPCAPAEAPEPEPNVTDVSVQLAAMARSLEAIAVLLERNLEGQRLGLIMQRVELTTARAAAAESQLGAARAKRDELADERARIESQLGHVADGLELGTLEAPPEELERMADESDRRLELIGERVRDIDRQMALLESSLTRYQREIEDWQALVDTRLSEP